MIHHITNKDKVLVAEYLVKKLDIPFKDAIIKTQKIIKSGLPSYIKDEKNLSGVCWVEIRTVNNIKQKHVEILCDNWRLAELFLKVLKWDLNGDYCFSIPKHHFLNRTYNKQGLKFFKCNGNNNDYIMKYEKRNFYLIKSDDED